MNCILERRWGESDSYTCYDILNKYITHLFLTRQFSQLYVTVTACGAQNTDMINIFIIVLYLFFHSGFCVPPIHQELPRLDGFSSKLIFHTILLLDAWGFNCRVSSFAIKCGISKGQI